MLVLTRRVGEQIFIDKGQIEIKILHSCKGHVAVGIKAPAHIDVDRKEIFIRKKASALNNINQEITTESN
ncbi:carbon storage regulator [Legionella sp.]|uniref:carbon storage regulator n=1 Tax=Legionella sp. TaxID=459 RepID=UPI000CB924E3|nr:carbon storage regulator [Legionella sp.]PJE14678.1 MAG: carbon storage regulator [Legionella sp.]